MIKEVLKGCTEIQKQHQESIRFGYEHPDVEAAIDNLKITFKTEVEKKKFICKNILILL